MDIIYKTRDEAIKAYGDVARNYDNEWIVHNTNENPRGFNDYGEARMYAELDITPQVCEIHEYVKYYEIYEYEQVKA